MIDPLVMIVEDDVRLRALIARGLEREGFEVEAVGTGEEALRSLDALEPEVVVLDIRLPDVDGRRVCEELRRRGERVPVIFLSGHDALPDRLAGFRAGGDDYLAKPFMMDELVARLRALMRRAAGPTGLSVEGLRLDPTDHVAYVHEHRLEMTPTEFRLLAALAAHAGIAVRRQDLLRAAWPHGAIVRENTLDAYIARLRRKLAEAPAGPLIQTVHGIGYSLV